MAGNTTVIWTTAEVPVIPEAVATAVRVYAPAARLLAVILKGLVWADPKRVVWLKNETFVTVPLPTVALAEMVTLAGAAKMAFAEGLVRVTVGPPDTGGVERV